MDSVLPWPGPNGGAPPPGQTFDGGRVMEDQQCGTLVSCRLLPMDLGW